MIIGRSINIHFHLGMLQAALGWENMRYVEAFSGGQFGIKIDVISEGIAGAAALHFKRPVRYIPSLAESMLMTSKRHAFDMQVKLAADHQGNLTAYCNDFLVDNGAYHSIGHVVINRALLMLSGSYNIPNVAGARKAGLHQQPLGQRGAGRGAAAGQLRPGMRHGHAGGQARHGPVRIPAAELLEAGSEQIHRPGRAGVAFPELWKPCGRTTSAPSTKPRPTDRAR